jgi:hypothetical protein
MSKPHRDLRPLAVAIRRSLAGRVVPVSRAEFAERLTRIVERAQAAYLAKSLGGHLQARGDA